MTQLMYEIEGLEKRESDQIDIVRYSAWLFGVYTKCAIESSIGNSGWFKSKNSPPVEYPKPPFGEENKQESKQVAENREYIAMCEMKRRIKQLKLDGLPESPE